VADYRPDPNGAWVAALRAGALLVLPAARRGDLDALWPELGSTDAATRVIDRLTAGGVTSAPGFALVVREGGAASVRVVVRGPLTVRVGAEAVSGSGVATWSERAFDGATSVSVAIDDPADAADAAGPRYPIVEGVVPASVVDWNLADASTGALGDDAAPAGATAPGPVAVEPPVPSTPTSAGAVVPHAAQRPDEQTMVPVEDTVVGFSRTERPRIDVADDRTAAPPAPAASPAVVSTTTIIPPPGLSTGTALGDHDGLTVAASDIRRLREARDDRARTAQGSEAGRADDRLALRMPDGSFEPIAGELLLGRAPAIGRVAGSRMPRPVVIGAGDPDISRTHLRVAVEGGTAVVTDLESRNGTQVVAPGQPPMRLRPSEPTPVLPETVIDLGGGWTVQVVER
jgi:hypothetical protein